MQFLFSFFILTLISLFANAELSFRVQSQNLSSSEKAQLTSAIQTVLSLIPQKMKQNLSPVELELVKGSDRHMGSANKKRIQINANLLNPLFQLPADRASRHQDAETQLLASILHEVAHVYDLAFVKDEEYLSLSAQCGIYDEAQEKNPDCQYYRSRFTSVSQNRRFLLGAGYWIDTDTNRLKNGNYFSIRSPDYYEFKNPQEAFAVHFEYFILDPEYKCRKPILYKALENLLEVSPYPQVSCDDFTTQVFLSGSSLLNEKSFRTLDINRIYEVHWLQASQGQQAMSKFGHSMLRFIICAPGKKTGPDCLNDVSHHLVLNFRASVEDSRISYLAGLKGTYPSILYFSDYYRIQNEYTRDEFRDLFSFPLRLQRQEIRDLLEASLELHWAYEGRYYFISNNCATEALNLLKKALPFNRDLVNLSAVRPDNLFANLQRLGLVETPNPIQFPYWDSSKFPKYKDALENLIKAQIIPNTTTLEKGAAVPLEERAHWKNRALQSESRSLMSDLYMIEQRNIAVLTKNIRSQMALDIEEELQVSPGTIEEDLKESVIDSRALLATFRSPGHLLGNTGYGRPKKNEISDFLQSQKAHDLNSRQSANRSEVKKEIDQRMKDYEEELKSLSQILRELQIGMRLDLEKIKELKAKHPLKEDK